MQSVTSGHIGNRAPGRPDSSYMVEKRSIKQERTCLKFGRCLASDLTAIGKAAAVRLACKTTSYVEEMNFLQFFKLWKELLQPGVAFP